jgi:hypothetical protein
MITQQTVDQLATKFVQDVISYHNTKKYVVNTDITCVYDSLFNYLSGLNLLSTNCEDYELECELNNSVTGDYVFTPTVAEIPCNDQLSVTFSRSTTNCSNTVTIQNTLDQGPRPDFYTVNNSIYIESKINLVSSVCNVPNTTTINGGCKSTGCSNSYKAGVNFIWRNNTQVYSTNSYISEMMVYETDSMGDIVNNPITLDLNPATSPYYSGAGLTTLVLNDVKFSNTNWVNNMQTLMNNVSIYRYNTSNRFYLTFAKVNENGSFKRISVTSRSIHKPSDTTFGLNKQNGYIKIFDITADAYSTITNQNVSKQILFSSFYNSSTISTICGNLTPLVSGDTAVDVSSNSNFNNIILNSSIGYINVGLTGTTSLSCITNTIKAIYNTSNVLSVEWRNPSNVLISTTDSCTLTTFGTYTFKATLLNGCVITRTAQFPDQLLEVE